MPDARLFRRRAEWALRRPLTPSHLRALEVLTERGVVLDVGAGAGAGSLPVAAKRGRGSLVVGVDRSDAMLDAFRRSAEAAGVTARPVLGSWPGIAACVDRADVVVCHHVLYQVPELCPFAKALAAHARRRVVAEITTRHPQAWMADLWLRFHGIERPSGPSADDAEAALRETGLPVRREDHLLEMPPAGFGQRKDAVAEVCQRLHLPLDRAPEVEHALGDRLALREGLWSSFPALERTTTLWWDVDNPAA